MCFNFLTGGGTQDGVKEWQRNDLIFGLLLLPLVLASRFYFSIFTYFGTFEASGRQHFLPSFQVVCRRYQLPDSPVFCYLLLEPHRFTWRSQTQFNSNHAPGLYLPALLT